MYRHLSKHARQTLRLVQIVSGVSFFFLSTGSSATPVLECPQSIEEKSVRLIGTPPGWNTFVRAPLYLHGAAPMSGPPEQLGELADYEQKKEKGGWKNTYQLDGKFPEGKWLTYRLPLAHDCPCVNVCGKYKDFVECVKKCQLDTF